MHLTNKFNLPEPIVRAISRDPYTKGASDYSITELIDSPRVRVLSWKHDSILTEDVSERLFSLFGQAMHHVLERGAKYTGDTPEERLFMPLTIDGINITVSGSMDLQESGLDLLTITDYKVTTVYSFQSEKIDWVNQLNCYADLVRYVKGKNVQRLRVAAFLRDWVSAKARNDRSYPQAPMQLMDIPLWPQDTAHQFIIDRARLHIQASFADMTDAAIEPCTDEERWMSSPTYAVVKELGGRASRVFDNRDEALKYAEDKKNLLVEERKAEPKRCTGNWCKVAEYCDQWQKSELRKTM